MPLVGLSIVLLVAVLWTTLRSRALDDAKSDVPLLTEAVTSLEELYHESPIMMYSIDQTAVITRANKAWLTAMGYQASEVIGRPTREFIAPDYEEALHEDCREGLHVDLMANGFIKNLEVNFLTRAGERLHASVSANLLKTPEGNIRGAHCIILDETKHAVTGRELAESKQKIEHTFATLPIPMFQCTSSGHYSRANEALLTNMGVSDLDALNALGHHELFVASYETMSRSGETEQINASWSLMGPDDQLRDVRMSLRLVSVEGREPTLEGAFVDVTELETARREVVTSREYNRKLYDTTPVMMYTVDAVGVINDVNAFWLERTGYSREEVLGKKGFDFMAIEDRAQMRTLAHRHFTRNESITWEITMVKRNGERLEGRVFGAPLMDEEGKPAGAMCSFFDLTSQHALAREKARIEDELATAQKLEAIGQLAAGIAHEINTPSQYVSDNLSFIDEAVTQLQPLLDYIDRCTEREEAVDGVEVAALADAADLGFLLEELPSALTQSREGVSSISRIVLAMKEFSHPGSEMLEQTDLNRMIESVSVVARNEWKYHATMELDLSDDVGVVSCVPSAINQVLLNIIVNAGHAVSDARTVAGVGAALGVITVSTSADDDNVYIAVADTGIGMDEETQKKIFNPFFTTKEVGRGTGQGLAIARQIIIEKHGGTLTVESAPGEGSTFTVALPKVQLAEEQSAA